MQKKGIKIEMAFIDDVKKIIDDTVKIGNELNNLHDDYENRRKKLIGVHTNFNNAVASADKQYQSLRRKFLELGAEPDEKIVLLYKNMLTMAKDELARQKSITK
jgi:predicted  nucleic acid-binding Zn-ribbon protein